LSLSRLLAEFPDIRLNKVELLTNYRGSCRDGVHVVPSLISDDKKLSGMFLTKKRVRRFLESL